MRTKLKQVRWPAQKGGDGSESTDAGTTAPVPRSVAAKVAWLNKANVVTPTMRIGRVAPWTATGTICPSRSCNDRRVRSPRAISPGAAGAWPASRVRKSRPRSGCTPTAGMAWPPMLT
jgi:hypothetical protein